MADLNQDFEISVGDAKSLAFAVSGQMSAPTFVWKLAANDFATALVTKTGAMSNENGVWTANIFLVSNDTSGLESGIYKHQLSVVDDGATCVSAYGSATLHPKIP